MVRRVGIVGAAALLAVTLAAGCVTTGGGSDQPRRDEPLVRGPAAPSPPSLVLPQVVPPPPAREAYVPPPPPPPPDLVQPVQLSPPAPLPALPAARAPRPADADEPPPVLAVRCFLENHRLEALEWWNKFKDERPQEALALYEQLDQATAGLRPRAPLAVEKMCYCRRISNYGLYDPLPDDHGFLAGVDRRHGELVQLYVEVRNFVNRRNGSFYETSLGSRLEIRDGQGGLVARMDFPAQPDRSLSPRQDYFIHYQFHVPAMMEPGDYTLSIALHDDNAPGDKTKLARRSLPFRVCAGPAGRGAAR